MRERLKPLETYTFHALTPDRWADLEALFGPRGAVGGCWCMTMRRSRSEYEREKGDGNRQAFQRDRRSRAAAGNPGLCR